jgi:hypothetical protein
VALYARLPSVTMVHVEKVRPQFLSLRQFAQDRAFSERGHRHSSPVAMAISNLGCALSTARTALLFSEWPVSLRSSGLRPFGTDLEI